MIARENPKAGRIVRAAACSLLVVGLIEGAALAEKKLYLANYYAGITSMNLDGTGQETIAGPGYNWRSVCWDPAGVKIYWLCEDGTVSWIRKANLDGSDVQDVLMSDDYYKPVDIELDTDGGKVYWSDIGHYGSHGGIYRCNLDGSDVQYLVSEANIGRMSLDLVRGKVYWTSFGANWIRRANLDGSSQETVMSEGNHPRGVAVDAVAQMIYWTSGSGYPRIQCANLDGSDLQVLVDTGQTDMRILGDIVLDREGGKMYWVDENPWVSCANLDGSDPRPLTTGSVSYAGDIALIPEPACALFMLVAIPAMLRRRRRAAAKP